MTLALGALYAWSVFVAPLEHEFGWKRAETSTVFTIAVVIWSIAEIVAWTSQGEHLLPGMLLGSGTCNGGSTIEIGRRLAPGDAVELEIEGLGVLRNRLGVPVTEGWLPEPRKPPTL